MNPDHPTVPLHLAGPKPLLRQYRVAWRRPGWGAPRYRNITVDPGAAEREARHLAHDLGPVAEIVIQSRVITPWVDVEVVVPANVQPPRETNLGLTKENQR